jgi:hypothetical protein
MQVVRLGKKKGDFFSV